MFEPEAKANPDPVEAGPEAMSVDALVEWAVTALDEFGEGMAGFIMAGGPRTPLVAALRNHQATMALVLRRLGRIARATLECSDTQSALALDLVARIEALETVLAAVLPDDPPASGVTVRLGPAFTPKRERPFFKPAGADGEPGTDRRVFRDDYLTDALRVMGFDGPESTIEIPVFEPSAQFEVGWDGLARRKEPKADQRVVYGATCSWWETIDKVATRSMPGNPDAPGLPCCPHCRGVLFEVESEAVWLGPALDEFEANGHPGYRAMIEWGRGRCFRPEAKGEHPLEALRRAYVAETGTELSWTL